MIGSDQGDYHIENDKSKEIKMSESKSAVLSREISEFLAILQNTGPDREVSESNEVAQPHMEQIDFDRLQQLLNESIIELDTVLLREKEAKLIRTWFITRITSLRCARHALLSQKKPDDSVEALDKKSLPDLVDSFEEESTHLRSSVNIRPGKSQVFNSADDYRQFKS